jgi:hypothetical protein
MSEPWRDRDTLHRLYWGEELSTYGVADRLGVAESTIMKWMKELDVPRREGPHDNLDAGKGAHPENQHAKLKIHPQGYEQWRCYAGDSRDGVLVQPARELRGHVGRRAPKPTRR